MLDVMSRMVNAGRSVFYSARNMMKVVPIPVLSDNYMYLLIDETTKKAAVVDPVDKDALQTCLGSHGVKLESALVTHHHWDHAGVTSELMNAFRNQIKIYGGDDRIASLTDKIADKDTFKLGALNVQCLFTPCHTTGHICYYVTASDDKKAVFTGDTLFIAGCGRFFEGTGEQMDFALNEVLAKLPDDTEVYCGHEYTVANLKFAQSVEPMNEEAKDKLAWARAQEAKKQPTVPSTIGEEKRINPFMRVRESKVLQELAKSSDPAKVMSHIRTLKNAFTG